MSGHRLRTKYWMVVRDVPSKHIKLEMRWCNDLFVRGLTSPCVATCAWTSNSVGNPS